MGFFNALWIIPILAILIFLHELGHFVMARRAGVRVEEFGFGLPPRIWGVRRGDTLYSINAIPVGGFVRVLGEDGKSFDNDSMQSKTPGQRARFLAAGSIMNFLTAFVLMALIVGIQGETRSNVYVTDVMPGSPAAAAGLQSGDRFVVIGDKTVDSDSDISSTTSDYLDQQMPVTVEREGQFVQTSVTPRSDPPPGEGRIGIRFNYSPLGSVKIREVPAGSIAESAGLQEGDTFRSVNGQPIPDDLFYSLYLREHLGERVSFVVSRDGSDITVPVQLPAAVEPGAEPLGAELLRDITFTSVPLTEVPGQTVSQFFGSIGQMANGVVSLVTGEVPLSDVAGPIGMGQLTSEVIDQSPLPMWVTLANLMFILSLNLGLLNLLPLPALDGGRLLFVAIEVLRRGKRVAPEKEGLVHFVGLVILLSLMFAIAFLDVDRLISGNSFLE